MSNGERDFISIYDTTSLYFKTFRGVLSIPIIWNIFQFQTCYHKKLINSEFLQIMPISFTNYVHQKISNIKALCLFSIDKVSVIFWYIIFYNMVQWMKIWLYYPP